MTDEIKPSGIRTWIDMPLHRKILLSIRVFYRWAIIEDWNWKIILRGHGLAACVFDYMEKNGMLERLSIQKMLLRHGIFTSNGDAYRVIKQGGLKFRVCVLDEWETVNDGNAPVNFGTYRKGNSYLEIETDYQPPTRWYESRHRCGDRWPRWIPYRFQIPYHYTRVKRGWTHHLWPDSLPTHD